jgi:2,3-bisphosphoglycerate-independent phosphoglycerate mutase
VRVVTDVLVILDGASEGPDLSPSSLELAYTPALDRLGADGERGWLTPLAPGVPVGSETAIVSLLGWRPDGPVDRAAVEAAARGLSPGPGERVWRIDLRGGHRLLLIGPPPLPAIEAPGGYKVWPDGAVPPRILDQTTVVIGAAGAATGLGRLMGARVVVPAGATGRPGSNLAAKRDAALAAIKDGADHVVVHIGGPDEASHARDRDAKIAAIEQADRDVIGPLAKAVELVGGELRVCPDHGCDPRTGSHVGGPVPVVCWMAAGSVA